ncbi:MAG TPA: hypothetical protein VIF57_19385 [Polyangia bacterium]
MQGALLSVLLAVAAAPPASKGGAVATALGTIEHGLTSTAYQHRADIDTRRGIYRWDCSIMAAWILARTAPAARRAIGADKPLARDFYRVIERAPTDRPGRGWRRLTDVAALEPGDLFAWLKPEMFKQRPNTGHVGFAVSKPWRHPRFAGVWLLRIADATTELHGDDSRPPGGEGGFGIATIAFLVDAAGAPRAYGWYGEAQDPATFVPTEIAFGRVFL